MNDEELEQQLGNDMNCNYHLPKEFDNDIKHEKYFIAMPEDYRNIRKYMLTPFFHIYSFLCYGHY